MDPVIQGALIAAIAGFAGALVGALGAYVVAQMNRDEQRRAQRRDLYARFLRASSQAQWEMNALGSLARQDSIPGVDETEPLPGTKAALNVLGDRASGIRQDQAERRLIIAEIRLLAASHDVIGAAEKLDAATFNLTAAALAPVAAGFSELPAEQRDWATAGKAWVAARDEFEGAAKRELSPPRLFSFVPRLRR